MKIIMRFFVSITLSSLCLMSLSLAQTIEPMPLLSKVSSNEVEKLFAEGGSTPYDTIAGWYGRAQSVPFSRVKNTAYEGSCFYDLEKVDAKKRL